MALSSKYFEPSMRLSIPWNIGAVWRPSWAVSGTLTATLTQAHERGSIMETTKYRIALWANGRSIDQCVFASSTPRSAFALSPFAAEYPEVYGKWHCADNPDGSAHFTNPADVAVYFAVDPDFSSDPDYGGVPQRVQIICRRKDLNGRGNGTMQTRRVRLPDGTAGWASDLAEDVSGTWEQGSYLASQRRCCERGYFPIGTIVLEFESTLRGGPAPDRRGLVAVTSEAVLLPAIGDRSLHSEPWSGDQIDRFVLRTRRPKPGILRISASMRWTGRLTLSGRTPRRCLRSGTTDSHPRSPLRALPCWRGFFVEFAKPSTRLAPSLFASNTQQKSLS
jgi:hypothetical protein